MSMKHDTSAIRMDATVFRTLLQVQKAIKRGDHAGADRWTAMLERQLFCALRIDGLASRKHRPKRPLPPPLTPKQAPTQSPARSRAKEADPGDVPGYAIRSRSKRN